MIFIILFICDGIIIIIMTDGSTTGSLSGVKIQVSKAFKDIKNYTIILHKRLNSKPYLSDWIAIKNNSQHDANILYFRTLKFEKNIHEFLKSAELYSTYLTNTIKYEKELCIVPPLSRYALSQRGDEVEILHEFCGVPLRDLWSNFQLGKKNLNESSATQVIEDSIKINNMATIFSCCMTKLLNLVCGTLSPETILYDHVNSKIRIQDAYTLKHVDQVNESHPFYIENPGIYYCQTFIRSIPKLLNKSQAMTADIKALAICIWELGLPDAMSIEEFIDDGEIVVNELIKYDKIFENTKNLTQSMKLKSALLKILTTQNDLVHNMEELKIDLPNVEKNLEFSTVKGVEENTFTLNGKPYIVPGMKLRRHNKKNIQVYLISYENGLRDSFIAKKYGTINECQRENNILQRIEECNKVSPISTFARIKQNIETGPKELAIEYGGLSLSKKKFIDPITNQCQFKSIFNFMLSFCEELTKLRIYHGDIKPENISVNNTEQYKIFDYDISSIDLDPADLNKNKFDEDLFKVSIKGFTLDYCSPEILRALLENKTNIEINSFKSDMYSVAKTVLAVITQTLPRFDFIKTFYGANNQNEINDLVKDNPLNLCVPHKNIEYSKLTAIYYCVYNDQLINNIKIYKPKDIVFDEMLFRKLMTMLAAMVATDPKDRPNLTQLKSIFAEISDSANWNTFRYLSQLEVQIKKQEFKIFSFLPNHFTGYQYIFTYANFNAPEDQKENNDMMPQQIIKATRKKVIDDNGKVISLYIYSPPIELKTPNELNDLAVQVHCMIDNNLEPICYFIGGTSDINPIKSVYALENNLIVKKADMNYSRIDFGVVSWNNYIAVAGGATCLDEIQDEADCLNYLKNAEIYNAKEDKWGPPILLQERKKGAAMAYKNNKLYIIGGILPNSNVNSVEGNESVDIDINILYSKLIEVIDLADLTKQTSFKITTNLRNGICLCPAIVRDEDTIIVLKDLLIAQEPADSDETHCIYLLKLNAGTHEAAIECEKTDDDDISPYYGYEATDCFETSDGYIIHTKLNECGPKINGRMIEYNIKEKKFEVYDISP